MLHEKKNFHAVYHLSVDDFVL